MIERAIVHELVFDRDAGRNVVRACPRPDDVLARAARVMGWRSAREVCQTCGRHAVRLVAGEARCAAHTLRGDERAGWPAHSSLERRAANHDGPIFKGYSVVFGKPSVDLGGFREIVRPSFVERSLREKIDMRALADHDPSRVLGRSSAGTLRLKPDQRGLRVEIDAPDTTLARDLTVSVERRDVSGMSFAFSTLEDEWELVDDYPMRYLVDGRISESSIVSFPAYPDTTVDVETSGQARARARRDVEARLRLAR